MKPAFPQASTNIRAAKPAGRVFAGLVLLVLLAGCGQSSSNGTATPAATPTIAAAGAPTLAATVAATTGATSTSAQVVASPTATTLAEAATPTEQTVATAGSTPAATGKTFQNPVLQFDFADPDVIEVGNTFYAYATNASGRNVQMTTSPDMVNWDIPKEVMPALPSWAVLGGSYVWAPSVIQVGQQFVMYYTARDQTADKQCIGVATSAKPEGRFLDKNDHAFICVPEEGGDIDPSPMSDGGKLYLYWKNDGNCCGITTYIYGQELSPDGMSLVGKPTRLIENNQPWEGRVVEGPEMFKHGNGYYLFFSAGNYADTTYSVGYATCDGPLGPCKQGEDNPILHSKMEREPLVIGPGGESVLQVGDQTWMFYHVWNEVSGSRGDSRYMWLDKVDWKNNDPVVEGPTTGRQPDPVVP